ncbi:MAG: hypothetical protein JXR36_03315 [Bacteroidales bacterium]|nr:hypothetical protein [Bacteroidales bacterium]
MMRNPIKTISLLLTMLFCYNGLIAGKLAKDSLKEYQTVEEFYHELVAADFEKDQTLNTIIDWIVENIEYDITYQPSYVPLNTINRRKGVCQDYAELFKALCDLAMIECYIVSGKVRLAPQDIGIERYAGHAWNVVKIDNNYQIYDLTWASGSLSGNKFIKKRNNQYLNATPEMLINSHYPEDSKWQLLDSVISLQQFVYQPYSNHAFNNLGCSKLSPEKGIVRSRKFYLEFETDTIINSCHLFKWRQGESGFATGIKLPVKKEGNKYSVTYRQSEDGIYSYTFSFNNGAQISYKLITPGYFVSKPVVTNRSDLTRLINAYNYIFFYNDYKLFKKLNPNTEFCTVGEIKYASAITKSLENWYGENPTCYGRSMWDEIIFPIKEYEVVLEEKENSYIFKYIKKKY